MTAAQILRTLRAAPFRPFRMFLADGRLVVIRHPELLVLAGGGRIANVRVSDDVSEAIDVLLVVSVRPLVDAEADSASR
ncbi:MAG TPA: hypothetical protein VK324_02085 [Tepidisphaeraceae bacterium]|nr:hypothetical protein [Tepidisphaeraceae bacterium]